MNVYATCSSYVLGRMFGAKAAERLMTEAVRLGEASEHDIPAARAIRHAARTHPTTLHVDGGGTHLAKTRSRHFSAALASTCDVWLSVDDDTEADEQTIGWLLAAVDSPEPRVCLAPCLIRGADSAIAAVRWAPLYLTRKLPGGGLARAAESGGFGLVAVNRAAMRAISENVPDFRDDDDHLKCAAFLEVLEETPRGTKWLGEDLSFFKRCEVSAVKVEALVSGRTTHAGRSLELREANT